MISEHFGLLPSGISRYSVDYSLKSAKVSGFTQKLKTQSVPRSKHFSSRLLKAISLCCKWHKSLFVLR